MQDDGKMVIGHGVGFEEIVVLPLTALVWKLNYKVMDCWEIEAWDAEV